MTLRGSCLYKTAVVENVWITPETRWRSGGGGGKGGGHRIESQPERRSRPGQTRV